MPGDGIQEVATSGPGAAARMADRLEAMGLDVHFCTGDGACQVGCLAPACGITPAGMRGCMCCVQPVIRVVPAQLAGPAGA